MNKSTQQILDDFCKADDELKALKKVFKAYIDYNRALYKLSRHFKKGKNKN